MQQSKKRLTQEEWVNRVRTLHCGGVPANQSSTAPPPDIPSEQVQRALRSAQEQQSRARMIAEVNVMQRSNQAAKRSFGFALAKKSCARGAASVAAERADEAEREFAEMRRRLPAGGRPASDTADVWVAGVPSDGGVDDSLTEAEKVALEEMRTEPLDATTCAEKFQLFEVFSGRVSAARKDVEELIPRLPAVARDAATRQLEKMDGEQSRTGVYNDSRNWFAYDMTRASISNLAALNAALESVRAKLNLLSDEAQPQCPICMEAWTAPGAEVPPGEAAVVPRYLGCCHRVCEECWSHWSETCGNDVYCPLCRYVEFRKRMLHLVR